MWRPLRPVILIFLLLVGCGPSSDTPPGEQIDAVMRTAAENGFTGSVMVTRTNALLYQSSFGLADRAKARAISADTPFLIASLSKPLTAVLILRLVEQGRLTLDARLDQIFPQLAGAPAAGVTVAQFLSHTSGIEEVIEKRLPRPLEEDDLRTAAITGVPGRHAYSSSGYVILKLIAEKAGRASYSDLVAREIFVPAGMMDSGVLRDGLVSDLALAYASDGAVIKRSAPLAVLDGAGSLYSTVSDLRKFDQTLSSGHLLSQSTQDLMNNDQTGSNNWGYGWALSEQGGKYYPWHRGDFDGYHALLVRQIASDERIIILSNSDSADIADLKTKFLRILRRTRPGAE